MTTITIKPGEAQTDAELDRLLSRLLTQVKASLRKGEMVTVTTLGAMMTTQQAADFLGVSRPTFIKMIDDLEIPVTKIGRHRRVAASVVEQLDRDVQNKRRKSLDELRKISTEMGEYSNVGANPLIR
jgi:excisionase family DNA binding protein